MVGIICGNIGEIIFVGVGVGVGVGLVGVEVFVGDMCMALLLLLLFFLRSWVDWKVVFLAFLGSLVPEILDLIV